MKSTIKNNKKWNEIINKGSSTILDSSQNLIESWERGGERDKFAAFTSHNDLSMVP